MVGLLIDWPVSRSCEFVGGKVYQECAGKDGTVVEMLLLE